MKNLVVGTLFLFFVISCSFAEILSVGEGETYSIIQEAVDTAVDGDTILVMSGHYNENIRIRNQNIVLMSEFLFNNNPDIIASTIIDGAIEGLPDTASCISIYGTSSTPEIAGFTLIGGTGTNFFIGNARSREGGGIYSRNASPYIHHNMIYDNDVPFPPGFMYTGGGGISTWYGEPIVENNYIERNTGDYAGGIIFNFSAGFIRNNVISNNDCNDSYGGGGGIMIYTPNITVEFNNNTLFANSCNGNGGDGIVAILGSTVNGTNNIFLDNGQDIHITDNSNVNMSYSCVESGFEGTGNIISDPLFDETYFTLLDGSSCIDSGNLDESMNDLEDPSNPGYALPPARGTLTSDMGAFGGPYMSLFDHPSHNSSVDPYCCPTHPEEYYLAEVYPNPFNPTTTISFQIDNTQTVKLTVYNALGKEITTLVNGQLSAGVHSYSFDASNLSSGQYYYTLQTGKSMSKGIMTLLK